MLSPIERDTIERCRRMLRTGRESMADPLIAIIDRLTSPRAVLDEAERLLRERKVWDVFFLESHPTAKVVLRVPRPNVLGVSIADAYEALVADGKGGL